MLGQVVHFILDEGPNKGQCRAAIITDWNRVTQAASLAVFPADMSDGITQLQSSHRARKGIKKAVVATEVLAYRDQFNKINETTYYVAESTPGLYHFPGSCPDMIAAIKREQEERNR